MQFHRPQRLATNIQTIEREEGATTTLLPRKAARTKNRLLNMYRTGDIFPILSLRSSTPGDSISALSAASGISST
jgi:hypothetical protein